MEATEKKWEGKNEKHKKKRMKTILINEKSKDEKEGRYIRHEI